MIELQHRLSKAYIVIFKSLPSASWTPQKSDLPLSCNGFFPSTALPCVLRHPFCPVHPRHPALFIENRSKFQRTASTDSTKAVATPSVQSILAIMTVKRTGKSINSPPDQSLLPQMATHPSEPVDPHQSGQTLKTPSKPPYPAQNARKPLLPSIACPKFVSP